MFEGNARGKVSLESGQASPFAILLAALLGILVLAVLCTGAVFIFRGEGQADISGTSTAIAIANETTIAQNAQVTQTIAAMETEAARPTNTPTNTPVPPTNTPPPTDTPQPSPTPVLQNVEATPTSSLFGTSIFGATPTAVAGTGGTGGTGGGSGTLPQTGIDVGTAVAVALGLLLLLLAARRLRTE